MYPNCSCGRKADLQQSYLETLRLRCDSRSPAGLRPVQRVPTPLGYPFVGIIRICRQPQPYSRPAVDGSVRVYMGNLTYTAKIRDLYLISDRPDASYCIMMIASF